MADDVTFQSATPATPPAGTVVAADVIGGVTHQRVKIEHGADGTATDVSSASPLPVKDVARVPTWTDNVSLLAITTLARNAVSRTTVDWRTKWGGYVFVRMGRGGTAALSSGVNILARRTLNNNAFEHVVGLVQFVSQTAAAVSTTCTAAGSPNNAGVTSLTVASTTGFAAGDLILIQDNASPTTASEWCRVARVTSATVLLLDAPTISAHNNVAHTVRNKSDLFVAWIDGGSTWELVFDYGAQSTGDTITIEAWAQTLDSVAGA